MKNTLDIGNGLSQKLFLNPRTVLFKKFVNRLFSNPVTLTGAIIIFVMGFVSAFAFLIAPYDPLELHIKDRVQGPSSTYWLGTDEAGRDLLSNLLYAGRISLSAAVAAEGAGILFGVPFGRCDYAIHGWSPCISNGSFGVNHCRFIRVVT